MPDNLTDTAHILLATDQVSWAETLKMPLVSAGFDLSVSHNADDVWKIMQSQLVDMVIAVASPEIVTLCQTLRQQYSSVMLLLVVPEENSSLIDAPGAAFVDALIPASPLFLERQVKSLLRLRRANHYLTARVNELESIIGAQKRMTSEIEILKNAIVRNVSHELRTPLLQVKSAVSLIKEEVEDKKLITYAENATARLETHVRNITMLGHSLDINIGPIILRDAVDYARRNLGRIWQRKSEAERIELHLEANLPPIMADKQGLSTVLQLLMDNALKFSETSIEVVGRQQAGKVYIAVRDYGIGIAQDKLDSIFESFYQIDSSSTRRYGGAGVGLALVKLILDHHESDIRVESEVGEGSTFWFTLPSVAMRSESPGTQTAGADA